MHWSPRKLTSLSTTVAVCLGLALSSSTSPVHAQLNVTGGTITPAVGPYDQSYFPGAVVEGTDTIGSPFGASGNNDQYTYVSSPDRTSKAQSFTTGTNAAGYALRTFTLRQAYSGTNSWQNNGTFFLVNNSDNFAVRIGTLSGTNYSVILETNAVYTGSSINTGGTGSALGTYFSFDLSGVTLTLNPNTTYFFELAATNGSDHFELNNTRTNPASRIFPPLYNKGRAFYGNTVNNLDHTGAFAVPPNGGVFEFVAALPAVGAPAVVVSVAPNNGVIGQSFKVTATVVPAAGTITSVTVNLSTIGGSSSASLVLSNANVYTNIFSVPAGAPLGSTYLTVTATDTTPLQGAGSALFTVLTPQTTTVNPTQTFQTIEGLGGATAFYQGWLTALPSNYKQEVYTNAFAGLNLSMLRFGDWYRYQTPLVGFDSAATEIVANATRVLGHPIQVYMSSWAPPAFLKSNGQVGNGGTLITNADGSFAYDGFAQYWFDSINAYKSNGVDLTWISIQNEPDWVAGYDSCIFHPTEDTVNGTNYASYSKALDTVYLKLTNLPSAPKILAPEVVHIAYNDLANYAATLNGTHFYGINYHLYGGDNSDLSSSTNIFPAKPHFMTEFGVSGLIETGMLIHNCLTLAKSSGFNYWSLVWPGTGGGLIQIENPFAIQSTWTNAPPGVTTQSHGWWLTPAYWGMKHFSYFIQPGFKRVAVTNTDNNISSSAYLSPDGLRLVVVLINTSTAVPSYRNFNFGTFPVGQSSVFQTAGTNTYAGTNTFLSLGALSGAQTLPPQSITTVVLDRIITVGAAANPAPSNRATGVPLTSALNWTAGSDALSHAVYLGTSSNAVAQATPASSLFLGVVTNTSFSPTILANATNYWRVDEIAGINTNFGVVWSFSPVSIVKLAGAVIGSPGSWNNQGNTITKAFDGNTNSYYDAVNGTGDWAGMDLGNPNSVVAQIKYCPRAGFAARMVGGQFQGATVPDFSSGVVSLLTISATPPEGTRSVQTITNTMSFRYLRYIGPANGFCNVAEVEFWGISNTAPALAAIASRTIGAGMMLAITNVATDVDAPPQTLTFSLPNAPTNAVINTNTGVLTWRSLVTQADSTNPFTVMVADNGTPSLSATQSFTVIVTNLISPQIWTVSASGDRLTLQVNGASGPDYQILASTNLINWSAVFTTNNPPMPFVWTNNTTGSPMDFFRIKAGPPF
jgi:glucuronoarabinoxylan endo-1,4-beta-xylanase